MNSSIRILLNGRLVNYEFNPTGYIAPSDRNTELLIKGNEFLDSSGNEYTIIQNNVTRVSGGKFGNQYYFPNSENNRIDIPQINHGLSNILKNDFTIDTLVTFDTPNSNGIFSTSGIDFCGILLLQHSSGLMTLVLGDSSKWLNGQSGEAISNFIFTVGQRYHLALTRENTTYTLYVDGVSIGSLTYSQAIIDAIYPFGTNFIVGGVLSTQPRFNLNGYLEMFRISSMVKWSGNFTPPVNPYFL